MAKIDVAKTAFYHKSSTFKTVFKTSGCCFWVQEKRNVEIDEKGFLNLPNPSSRP